MQKEPEYYPFEGSKYDFDAIIEKMGYTKDTNRELEVVFEKKIDPNEPMDMSEIKPVSPLGTGYTDRFSILISRPKRLVRSGKYDICSPYAIKFNYITVPTLIIRRMQWDTFPGGDAQTLAAVIAQCQGEAESVLCMFIDMDIQILKLINKEMGEKAPS